MQPGEALGARFRRNDEDPNERDPRRPSNRTVRRLIAIILVLVAIGVTVLVVGRESNPECAGQTSACR